MSNMTSAFSALEVMIAHPNFPEKHPEHFRRNLLVASRPSGHDSVFEKLIEVKKRCKEKLLKWSFLIFSQ